MSQSVSPVSSCSVTYVMAMFNGKPFLLNNVRYVPLKNPIPQFCFASCITNLRNRLWGTTLELCCGKDRLLFLRDVYSPGKVRMKKYTVNRENNSK